MKLTLTLKERLVLPSLYPKQGYLLQQATVKEIAEKTTVTKEEIGEYDLKPTPTGYKWDEEKAKEKEIEFSLVEVNFLQDQVSRLDKERNITQANLDLCLKIKKLA